MAKEELLITIVMLWKEVYNRNGKMTPEIHDFSITGENKFMEEVSSKIHIQYVKVPLKFFDMPRDKQFTYLKKLADINKIQKFKTVAELLKELQEFENKDALVKILYYTESDDEAHYSTINDMYEGYNGDFEIDIT